MAIQTRSTSNDILADEYKILSEVEYYSGGRYSAKRENNTIKVLPNDILKGNDIHKELYKRLQKKFPQTEFKFDIDGNIGKIRVIRNGRGSVHVLLPKGKRSSVLKPGEAYELYFHSVLMDGIRETKLLREELSEFPHFIRDRYTNLSLVIRSGKKSISIGNIKSADKVGQKNKKPDILINRYIGAPVKISLKQSNFFSWSSADTYNPRFSPRVRKLLDGAIANNKVSLGPNNEVIFPPGINGLRIPATPEEIKYYVFGDGSDKVDYVVVHAASTYYDYDTRVINMVADKIYNYNSQSDLRELSSDVFLVIYSSKSSPSTFGREYKNVSVRYANRSHAYNAIDKSKYMDI